MKRNLLVVFVLVCSLLVAACGNDAADHAQADSSNEPITLKFAVSQAESHSLYEGAFVPFMEKVTEATDGQVEFEFYPSEQLGKAADLYQLTSDGVTDLSFFIASYDPSSLPITSGLVSLPGLYDTAHEGTVALHELVQQDIVLETDFLNNGVRPVFSYALPPYELWTRGKEIKAPKDLKGEKVRVTGEILNKLVAKFGATPINMTAAETYEGFERGVFGAVALGAGSLKDYSLEELAEFGTYGVSFGGLSSNILINEKVYESLPEHVQKALMEVGAEMSVAYAQHFDEVTQEVMQKFIEEGGEVHELSDAEKAEWQAVYDEFEQEWLDAQNNKDLKSVLESYRSAVEKVE